MFVLQAIEDAEDIANDNLLPAYMSDRPLWLFPSGCKPRIWAAKLLAFWYYHVSPVYPFAHDLVLIRVRKPLVTFVMDPSLLRGAIILRVAKANGSNACLVHSMSSLC